MMGELLEDLVKMSVGMKLQGSQVEMRLSDGADIS